MLDLALSLLLSTKTPYAPQQDSASYEAAPASYKAVYTQLLARHGSRGLTSAKTVEWLHALWQQAAEADALTPLGRQLGPDLEQMMRANEAIGYGNETQQGLEEHTQLAARLHARLPALFRDAERKSRRIVLVSSGKDRAVDSAEFFRNSLVRQQPGLAPLFDSGVDRYTLYFHKLNSAQDTLVTESSLAYQRWVKSDALQAREAAIHAQPQLQAAAHATLARLFAPAFIKTLDATDVALSLYAMYAAAADMKHELKADFSPYIAPAEAHVYAEAEDAVTFFEKGPGSTDNGGVNWRMAGALVDDFFKEADAIDRGDLSHAAKLRFAHAEVVIPLASALGLPGMSEQLPRGATYSYQNSPWRGAQVAPMAANIQWELYQNSSGRTLVRLLYNERETDFKAACRQAKIAPSSHFYDYKQLKRCYK